MQAGPTRVEQPLRSMQNLQHTLSYATTIKASPHFMKSHAAVSCVTALAGDELTEREQLAAVLGLQWDAVGTLAELLGSNMRVLQLAQHILQRLQWLDEWTQRLAIGHAKELEQITQSLAINSQRVKVCVGRVLGDRAPIAEHTLELLTDESVINSP